MIGNGDRGDFSKWKADPSFLLFALGSVAGLVDLTSTLPFGPGFEMVAIATNLAKYGAYANPLLVLPSGPSALAPPLYPLFLALCMKVFQIPAVVLWVVSLGAIFANALTAALLPRISLFCFSDIRPGILAAVFWVMAAQTYPSWDVNYTVPVLLLFCLFTASTVARKGVVRFGFYGGLLAGASFLLNPMTLLVFFPWLLHLLVSRKADFKHVVRYCLVVLGTVVLVASPWIVRNYIQFGSIVVRTGLGLNIYLGNNDCSRTNLFDDLQSGCAAAHEPNFNLVEAQAYRDLGEVNYDRSRLAIAKEWIRTHPDRFLSLTFSRVLAFWFPQRELPIRATVMREEPPFRATVVWVVTLLSLPGLALMAYRRVAFTVFSVAVLLVYPLIYYVVTSEVRFRYPILWLTLLPAGYLLVWVFGLVQPKLRWATSRRTIAAGQLSLD